MSPANPFASFAYGEVFDTILPDFVLSFAFFTALVYAVLGRRFGQQRPAVAMSAALGMALSVGLVSWEYYHGYSIRSLGPIAAGFAIIVLAGVIYQSIKGVGGSWAGAGIALGASLLIGWTLGLDWPVDREIGSSDVGNVSQVVPTIQPMLQISPREVTNHMVEFAQAAASERGHQALAAAAKAMAMTALDLALDSAARAAVAAEFRGEPAG